MSPFQQLVQALPQSRQTAGRYESIYLEVCGLGIAFTTDMKADYAPDNKDKAYIDPDFINEKERCFLVWFEDDYTFPIGVWRTIVFYLSKS